MGPAQGVPLDVYMIDTPSLRSPVGCPYDWYSLSESYRILIWLISPAQGVLSDVSMIDIPCQKIPTGWLCDLYTLSKDSYRMCTWL